ncbi:hypothetical protein PM082_015689 [Marasmius tenuissimus]|nr:hypothetical protein PM082_015689 [Marasmius tenuissimus]
MARLFLPDYDETETRVTLHGFATIGEFVNSISQSGCWLTLTASWTHHLSVAHARVECILLPILCVARESLYL